MYKKMKFLLSRPGVVISESVLIAVLVRNCMSVEVLRLMLAGNFDVNIVTSEAVLVAAARSKFNNARELLELLLKSATDAKTKVKEKKTEAPVETQQEFPSLLPKDRKVYITEKVLVAAAQGGFRLHQISPGLRSGDSDYSFDCECDIIVPWVSGSGYEASTAQRIQGESDSRGA